MLRLCDQCGRGCEEGERCAALTRLYQLYQEKRTEEKRQLLRTLRSELDLIDAEPSEEMQELGEAIIAKFPELAYIHEYEIKVGYVLSYEAKKKQSQAVFGECVKVTGPYKAYLPYDFVIVFYEPNIVILTENQKKILMLHKLQHIALSERGDGFKIRPHDIEDYRNILEEYGIGWADFENQEVPDILL